MEWYYDSYYRAFSSRCMNFGYGSAPFTHLPMRRRPKVIASGEATSWYPRINMASKARTVRRKEEKINFQICHKLLLKSSYKPKMGQKPFSSSISWLGLGCAGNSWMNMESILLRKTPWKYLKLRRDILWNDYLQEGAEDGKYAFE